jgi:hypothetical protein
MQKPMNLAPGEHRSSQAHRHGLQKSPIPQVCQAGFRGMGSGTSPAGRPWVHPAGGSPAAAGAWKESWAPLPLVPRKTPFPVCVVDLLLILDITLGIIPLLSCPLSRSALMKPAAL